MSDFTIPLLHFPFMYPSNILNFFLSLFHCYLCDQLIAEDWKTPAGNLFSSFKPASRKTLKSKCVFTRGACFLLVQTFRTPPYDPKSKGLYFHSCMFLFQRSHVLIGRHRRWRSAASEKLKPQRVTLRPSAFKASKLSAGLVNHKTSHSSKQLVLISCL